MAGHATDNLAYPLPSPKNWGNGPLQSLQCFSFSVLWLFVGPIFNISCKGHIVADDGASVVAVNDCF